MLDALLLALAERDKYDSDPSVPIVQRIGASSDPRVMEAFEEIAANSTDDGLLMKPLIQ